MLIQTTDAVAADALRSTYEEVEKAILDHDFVLAENLAACCGDDAERLLKIIAECRLVYRRYKSKSIHVECVADLRRVRTRRSLKLARSEFNFEMCVSCFEKPPSVTYLPCNHRCVCLACNLNILIARNGHTCPICRTYVDGYRFWD